MDTREFVVRFRPTIAGIDGLKALRATLKFALRRFGLRTVDAYEVLPAAPSQRLAVESLVESSPSS